MSELLDRLRDHGIRLTSQRRVIAEVLSGPHTHLTAEEVLQRAREHLPEIGTTTVYSTLNEFVAIGEVDELILNDGVKRYDPNVDDRHQHFVCGNCDGVFDIKLRRSPSLTEVEQGFDVRSVEVTFRGHCPACARALGDGEPAEK